MSLSDFGTWLFSIFQELLNYLKESSLAKFLGFKTAIITFFTVVIPTLVNNFIHDFMNESFSFVNDQVGSIASGAPSFSGLIAYLLNCLMIPEIFSLFVSALFIHYTLKLIPFSPVR